VNLDELERLYQETTQGEWGCFDPVNNHVVTTDLVDGMYGYPSAEMVGTPDYDFTIAVKNAFPALLALARDGERYREMEQKLRDFADAEHVLGIDIATYSAACQGIEAKLASGTFGAKELKAHEKMNRHFGAHFGIHAAIDAARKGESNGNS